MPKLASWLISRRALLALVVLACAHAAPASAADTCNPLSTETCLAPFPSDYWADDDPTSPTGKRANVTDEILRDDLLHQLPVDEGISPSGIFNGATGFSAGAGAVFEFAQHQGPVPPDGGDLVTAYDLTAGERVPVHAFMSVHARNPLVVGAQQSNVLQVFARSRWPFGHRIVVAVSTGMGAGDPAYPARAAKAQPGRAAAYVGEVTTALGAAGLAPASVRTATLFTVRNRAEVVDATQRLMDDTSSRPHETRDVRPRWDLQTPWSGAIVTGQVRVDNYRTRGGEGPVDFTGKTRSDQWLPFQLTLPRSAGTTPAPLVIYAHGVSGQKETDILVSQMNASLGLATISIDWPNHGVRSGPDGGYILNLLNPGELGTLSGMFNQATLDLTGLYRAIGGLKVDVLRRATAVNPIGRGGDGRPDLDTSSISMQGTSLGGVLGMNFAALAPKLDFIDFHVTGVGLGHVLSQSVLWDVFGLSMPRRRNGTEDAVLQGALQQAVDPADGINTADFIRRPRAGQTKKPMLVIIGDTDAVVPNPTSVSLANLVDLPLTGPELHPMPGVRRVADFDSDGYAIRQYPPFIGRLPIALAGETTAHAAFAWPSAFEAQMRFIRRFGPR
ncbi:MAG: hypothetical protein JHC95_01680 [Solirubrobacteraceae bacterium]|nr:hypothetical protein [Solirubrobacteraceae bacterium]